MAKQQGLFSLLYTKLGRDILGSRHPPLPLACSKWQGILVDNFQFNWKNSYMGCKEGRLSWQLWHKAVAYNTWRSQISGTIDTFCLLCNNNHEKSPTHRFLGCRQAKDTRRFVAEIMLQHLNMQIPADPGYAYQQGQTLQMKQAVYADRLPANFVPLARSGC